ncbi:unnamed protein product [Chrysodeixis includens]|uniref:ABC transporter domain-containing protein n=1 Tax=Chrysodeixis includens TaxID=689277 RepID=A0A9P0BSV3_CHRIL|nr:unnamed protein product [Chrysodeixis includens]
MAGARQLRLLLWKDYLIRKRKLITLVGVLWATAVMLSLYIVRVNVDNQDFPTCGFPARALPSAGMLPFLQSFMCTVNNDCSPLDQFDEIPTYEKSKLTQLQRQLSPIMNETVLDVASSVPDAVKLLATLADVVDEPSFIYITKNGLRVRDLFASPSKVKRFVSDRLELSEEVADSVMGAELSFQGLLKGNLDRCSVASLNETIMIANDEHLNVFMERLCLKSMEELQKIFVDVLFEVDYNKYLTMLGDMYYKLTGDKRLNTLGDMLTAVLRMVRLQHFLPKELLSVFQGETVDFTYIQLNLIPKLMDLFKPTFGDTQAYSIIRDFTDAIVVGLQYLDKVFTRQRSKEVAVGSNVGSKHGATGLQAVSNIFHNAADVFEEAMEKDSSIDAFSILSQTMNFINKFLSAKMKHDVVFYSTLLAKLMESAHRVIDINMNIEQLTYNVTLRHPAAVEILKGIPPNIVGKAFEALADAERTQILTSKINFPGQMFCDVYKLQTFFVVSKPDAEALKKQLCSDGWKNYVSDLITSFGVFEVKNNINHMASLLIQETLGKDTTEQLYSIEQDFKVLKNFSQALVRIEEEDRPAVEWSKLFHVTDDSELIKVVRNKGHLGKQILIVIHGALAKEIVQQNPILDFKISPYLQDVITLVSGMNRQLELTPRGHTAGLKKLYVDTVRTMLMTALHEEKTYKALSTPGVDMLCYGVGTAAEYLELPPEDGIRQELVEALCNATKAIENGLQADSEISKAISTIRDSPHAALNLNWNDLITNMKDLYVKLDRDYPYLFQFSSYNMDEDTKRRVDSLFGEAKEYWFGLQSMERSLRLSVKLALRFLDIVDHGLFDISGEIWLKIKNTIQTVAGPFSVFDETVKLVAALLTNSPYTGSLPPTTVAALGAFIPAVPRLTVDAVDIILRDDTEVEPIISLMNADPPWPCSRTSLSELLQLSSTSRDAVIGLEKIFCLDRDIQDEWVEYLAAKNVSVSNHTSWNRTDYSPHLFLKFSATFDAVVDDILLARDALQQVFNDSAAGQLGMKEAWTYAVKALNNTDRDVILGKLFKKVDIVLNAVQTPASADVSVSSLWESFAKCSTSYIDAGCRALGRKAWKHFFEAFSVILENVAADLMTYFKEANEPESNLLQQVGFTRRTGLYTLYHNMPEFVGTLLNSYWDYGFMSQVRRASQSQFWDCDALVKALRPPPGSPIDTALINKVKPFICPSLLHWLSLPRGENTLLDVFSKPQYYFFTMKVSNLTSRFESAYTNAVELANYLTELSKKNQTLVTEEDIKMNTIEGKLERAVDSVLNYKINATDPSYRLFNEINMKQFAANIYLTKIVKIINKLHEAAEKLDITNLPQNTEENRSTQTDLDVIKYLYKRKPTDAVTIHFDILTDLLWQNDENYTLVDAFNKMCNDLKANSSKTILVTVEKARSQVCVKKYEGIYRVLQDAVVEDYAGARDSLVALVDVLKGDENVTDVFEFLSNRKQLVASLRASTKYAYELTLPVYLKYLQSNMQAYDVILTFLTGEDWWARLRALYNGPYGNEFFGYLENSFDVAEDLLSNFDGIHLVRLLHDIDLNRTESFCAANVTLSDYLPDRSGLLSHLKRQLCASDNVQLYKELPPLLFAAQGFESSLKLSKDIDYEALDTDIDRIESRLPIIRAGPLPPLPPAWVTPDRVQHLRQVALRLLSKETVTKMAFALLSNAVDAGTLFLNNSQCLLCSQFTTWFKQLNLQLFKKQEYDNLLCHLSSMTLHEVHHTLKNDFHWDMAIRELISTRNYTKYEMNKSINEFLGQVKLHLLEDMNAKTTKLTDCLTRNVSRNEFGNATLFATVLAHTAKLIRAQLPHIHEIEGVKDIQYLKALSKEVAHNLDILRPLKEYLLENNDLQTQLIKVLEEDVVNEVENALLNIRKVRSTSLPLVPYVTLASSSWDDICKNTNCSAIAAIIRSNINNTLIDKTLPKLQLEEFWRFNFVSSIILHLEGLVGHGARLLGLASRLDVAGLKDNKLEAVLDMMMLLINDETLDSVLYSLQGIVSELHPLLAGTTLEHDLEALSAGLNVLRQLKNYLLEEVDLTLEVSSVFPDAEDIESGLSALGINNTNFWSIAAPRVRAGTLQLKPLLSTKPEESHISLFVCQSSMMSRVVFPGALDVVVAEDVLAALADQLCALPDTTARLLLPVLLRNFNYTLLVDKVGGILLSKLYTASNLTQAQGELVLSKYQQMAALLPAIQDNMQGVGRLLANETLFQSLRGFSSVGNLLSSPDFLSSAGSMLCGKPFVVSSNRFYKSIAATPDLSTEPDKAQLEVLPTDFCRSLYVDIINVEGGKILWSFVKPLIMGKILYTPPSASVARIMEQANSTFATMIKMTNLVHSFAASFPAVGKLSEHREGIAVLRRVMTSPQFSSLRDMLVGEGEEGGTVPDVDVDGLFEQFGDINDIGSLLSKASDLLRCINLDRFQPSPSEDHMIHEAARLSIVNEFSAGVVFLNSGEQDGSLSNVQYKIRMDIDNAPTTEKLKDYLWIPGPEASFVENMRYFRGFVQIQDLVDQAIIRLSRQGHQASQTRVKRDLQETDWAVYTQQTPYPCYRKDYFQTSLYESQSLIVCFFFSLLFTVASAVRFIVSDKETGNTMLMSVMGVDLRWHSLSWFLWCLLEMVVTSAAITLVLHLGRILPTTDPSLVFTLVLIFGISVLSYCYMMSKLFWSASLAAVCAAVVYLVSFMPFIIVLSLEAVLYSSLKTFICLSMSSSLCYAFLYITRFEAAGAGAGWAQLWAAPGDSEDMSIGLAAAMMLLDAAIYFLIGFMIDRYFGIKTLKSSITHITASGEKAGVSIVNVSKLFGRKLALCNVSLELPRGHVTALLGHNGAGKTTLINILTGTLRPSRGHVVVRSGAASRTRLGACPQHDVLLAHMTPREHVTLYAQLKTGRTAQEVQDEVDKMLEVLSLGAVSEVPVTRLSGGTRRRLCVALAFVGDPHLVSLDEPTAGVDPAARRDIWSMIVKLKEDRTILLTTHHLDEAELLSDQIVIMHKGQIHTTGSPIEIKRTLGNGYNLTVTYPGPNPDETWEETSQEEQAKQLLTLVRDVVKNANVVDVNGQEVEIALPFFDANGLNNNFLQLCCVLEAAQPALGFRSYSLDCSSLEHVFFNICQQADTTQNGIEYVPDGPPSKSGSSSSIRTERAPAPLLTPEGPLRGSAWQQFLALMHARYIHHKRNHWLLFMLVVLPSLFVVVAMGFSMLRPPADNEVALKLGDHLYNGSTEFLVTTPSIYSKDVDPSFAKQVLHYLQMDKHTRNWTAELDSPHCVCGERSQQCDVTHNQSLAPPDMLLLPDVRTLNRWLVDTHDIYIEKRYTGYSAALKNNVSNIIAWYNNKGHHALPAALNAVNSALLRAAARAPAANITTYTHPLKISHEQISKATVYQHIADAGISGLVLIAYSLVSAGAATGLVAARRSQEKRLQLLCGVTPALYWAAALVWDMMIIVINMCITAAVMSAFGFPVFVARNNLPAICILFLLYGYACACLVHVAEKLFAEASVANMVLFCGNAFVGLSFIAILLIFDIISESEATDNARYVLHKVFLLAPQFALGDGMLEIAKNTIQAQVLSRFGMDTYRDPLHSSLVLPHYLYLVVVGSALLALNLAIEYDCFERLLARFRPRSPLPSEPEPAEVSAERARVRAARTQLDPAPLRVNTIGNINRGFIHTEGKKGSIQRIVVPASDVAQCEGLSKLYPALSGPRLALADLTLGIPAGQCTALLGENGAGKSTTFSMLTGELRPTAGKLYLNNELVSSTQLCNGLISYCPQSDAIDPLMTVTETLQFYCRLRGITDQDEVIHRTVEMFSLSRYTLARAGTLSGGNKRKLCAAIAFMARSPLVLLDEPTSGMDPVSRGCVQRGVQCALSSGRGVLLATHALGDARRLARRVALLRRGRLTALAPLDDCLNRFGGGWVVGVRARSSALAAWRGVLARAPHARLRVLHHHTLHFLVPASTTVDNKEVYTRLSDVFRLLADLQSTCDIEDYTVNQSSLEQMFLSFTDKAEVSADAVEVAPLPPLRPPPSPHHHDLDTVTAL